MNRSLVPVVMVVLLLLSPRAAASSDPLCPPLRAFLNSVRPDETREFAFRTSWGSNFKDDSKEVLFAKRCFHGGYEPASKVCSYLSEHGEVEFSGNNVKRALACISSKTRFAPGMNINEGSFSLTYGTKDRGSLVTMEYHEDQQIGGMIFRLTADGY